MAYPFAKSPTLGDFIARVREKGFTVEDVQASITGPRGPVKIRYLLRLDNGSVKHTEPLLESDSTPLGWDTLRRYCRQLGIDPRDLGFGLDLG